jgi:hypothetical protein
MSEWWIVKDLRGSSGGPILKYSPGIRRLGGVVISVLATGPKGREWNPAEAMDF